jgi:hypothetical protein
LLVVALAGPALAHEERTVGRFAFAVGFGDEPAYTGQKNSVQLLLHDADEKPVTDLTDTLKVEVSYGGQTLSLPLEPLFEVGEFGIRGDYRAWFFPTQPGDYAFHFTGSIKGQRVDETFTSGPSTFSPVEDPTGVEFPTKPPAAADVAARLDREIPRMTRAVAVARSDASHKADSARLVAFIGIGMGALGLLVAAVALVQSRRGRTAVGGVPAAREAERGA